VPKTDDTDKLLIPLKINNQRMKFNKCIVRTSDSVWKKKVKNELKVNNSLQQSITTRG
jgi:hypothetical protein